MPPKVLVRDLRKRYGQVAAADGVSFEVDDGEVFGLIGPNGAGKTTTIECLIGLRQPDEGTIEVCGVDARTRPRDVKQRIGAALQTTALQDKITPREAVVLFSALYDTQSDPDALLGRFSLADLADRAFDTLSIGQRQRLALALAFVNDPEVVILDEPTAGLDPQSRRDLRAEIAGMRREGRTVLMTTHDLEEAEMLCDRVAVIHRGRIVATGAPGELTAGASAAPTLTVRTAPAMDAGWLDDLPHIEEASYEGAVSRCRATRLAPALAAVAARVDERHAEITELHVQKASLEDVVIALTAAAARD